MKSRKILVALLALLFLVATTATATEKTPGEIVIESQQYVAEASNYTADMEMTFGLTSDDFSMAVTMNGSMAVFTDPLKAHCVMEMSMMGQDISIDQYMIQDGDVVTTYANTSMGGESMGWVEQDVEMESALSQYDIQKNLEIYAQSADSFVLEGEEEVNGVMAQCFSGVISMEGLGDIMDDMMGSLGISTDEEAVVQIVVDAIASSDGIPVMIWIDPETTATLRYSMDMTDMMDTMMTSLMDTMVDEPMNLVVDECTMIMDIVDLNETEDFDIPDEVFAAGELEDDDAGQAAALS